MKIEGTISILILGVIFMTITVSNAAAEVGPNQVYLVEGSGFAITEKSIKTTQMDFLMSTGNQAGSRSTVAIEDGFVTINEMDFIVSDVSGNLLSEARFIRLVGTAENTIGSQVSISLFGKLIDNSEEGSIYSFTGRITEGAESNRVIFTTKISGITSPQPKSTAQTQSNEIIVRIEKGSSNPSQFNYIQQDTTQRTKFYSMDRISITPGMTIKFINDDTASHSISSGTRDTSSRAGIDIPDGKIVSGEIKPGASWSIKIEEIGFLRLFDVDYPWMTMDVVVFPDTQSTILKKSSAKPLN